MSGPRTVPYPWRQHATLVLLLAPQPLLANSATAPHGQLPPRAVRRGRHRGATGACARDDQPGRGRKADSAPLDHALGQAVACALVAATKQPLSRQSLADGTDRVRTVPGTPLSRSTGWRICLRFTISASYRKAVERHLQTAQRLGQVRQVKYFLAILTVVEGQSFAQVAAVVHVQEKTVATWVRLFCCYGLQGKPPRKPTG